jgi:hypothetical protein
MKNRSTMNARASGDTMKKLIQKNGLACLKNSTKLTMKVPP